MMWDAEMQRYNVSERVTQVDIIVTDCWEYTYDNGSWKIFADI